MDMQHLRKIADAGDEEARELIAERRRGMLTPAWEEAPSWLHGAGKGAL